MDDRVRFKLRDWNLKEYITRFEDEHVNYERFLKLDTSDRLEFLIPKIGPRARFRKTLQEFKQHNEELDTNTDPAKDQEDSTLMATPTFPGWDNEKRTKPKPSPQTLLTEEQGLLATQLFALHHQLSASAHKDLITVFKAFLPNLTDDSFTNNKIQVYKKKKKESDFFLLSSLKDLLKDILKSHGTKLLPKTSNYGDEINDIIDGKAYQKLILHKKLTNDDITLLWNSDGVPVQEYSIWPLQFTINELPYHIRKESVLVPGLWFGSATENPDMKDFLEHFIDECKQFAKTPLEWMDDNGTVRRSRVFALVCSSDAVARPLLRNTKQFNGEYGCDWCLHPGTVTNKGTGKVRSYVYDEQKQKARSKEMFHSDARRAVQTGKSENGVKGLSILQRLPDFDIVLGFVPEYSHAVLLGVTKQLVFLWLEERKENISNPWYIGNRLDELETCLHGLKQDLKTTQSPLSLKYREKWNAVNWQAFLLFFGLYLLERFLAPEYLQHFHLLSCSVHMLLHDSITQDMINCAHANLVRFVQKMALLYGEENVTFNCHQLIHLCDSVRNWGPLWATSALSFEKNNKKIQKLLSDTTNNPKVIQEEVLKKFTLWQHIPSHIRASVFSRDSDFNHLIHLISSPINPCNNDYTPLGDVCNQSIDDSINAAVEDLLKEKVLINAFESFTTGHTVYHCAKSNVTNKTKCTIKMKNGSYGEVHLFLEAKKCCMCTSSCSCLSKVIVVRMFDTSPAFRDHDGEQPENTIFVRVKETGCLKAFYVHDIKCECVNVKGFVAPIPNTQETY